MNDKELIKKLSALKEIKPESSWKQETRDILLAQVSNSVNQDVKVRTVDIVANDLKNFFSFLPANAWAVICLVIIMAGGSFGVLAAKNSKPGDPLYVAKLWKEKLQLGMTFNQEDKAKLDMKLASIHAEEIAEVLSNPDFDTPANQKKSAELAQNFKQEINTVKARYSELNNIKPAASVIATNTATNESTSLAAADDNAAVGIGNMQKDADSTVHGVESGKDSKGLQFYDPKAEVKIPTSTKDNSIVSKATTTGSGDSIDSTLDKASQSFDTKDFSAAKDMLAQVGKIINNIDAGSVKGATEAGSSTAGNASTEIISTSSGK